MLNFLHSWRNIVYCHVMQFVSRPWIALYFILDVQRAVCNALWSISINLQSTE